MTMVMPFGFRQFVRPRIPVVSEPNVPVDTALPVKPPTSIELKWGAPSFLNFNLELGPQDPNRKPRNVVIRPNEHELIQRWGVGEETVVDHENNVVLESRILNTITAFYIKDFDELTEEIKTVANVTTIIPTITHVSLYVQWSNLPEFGEQHLELHLRDA